MNLKTNEATEDVTPEKKEELLEKYKKALRNNVQLGLIDKFMKHCRIPDSQRNEASMAFISLYARRFADKFNVDQEIDGVPDVDKPKLMIGGFNFDERMQAIRSIPAVVEMIDEMWKKLGPDSTENGSVFAKPE